MNWIFWVQIAILTNVIEKIVSRYFLKGTNSHYNFLIGYNLGALLIPLCSFKIMSTSLNFGYHDLFLLIFSGVFWYYSCLWSFKVDEQVGASESNLISQAYLIFILIGGVVFFHDKINIYKISGIILICMGLAPLSSKVNISKKNFYLKISSASLMAAAMLIDKSLSQRISPSLITLSGYGIPFLLGPTLKKLNIQDTWEYSKKIYFMNIGMGILSGLGYFSIVSALALEEVSVVIPFYQIRLIFITILSITALKEKHNIKQKILLAILILIGSVGMQWV
jgi:transporter family protein